MLSIQRCRVCGKEYEACHTLRQASNTFRWQAVACSPECGEIFLSRILASRGIKSTEEIVEGAKAVSDEVVTKEVEVLVGKEEIKTRKKKAGK